MATAYQISLGPNDIGAYHYKGYNEEAAKKVSELLQHNLENHNIIFAGLRHNHIVHCILSIYALGASPEELQKVYDREAAYQKPKYEVDEESVKAMADKVKFYKFIDQEPQYSNYLAFFQREIDSKGVKATLEEHLFAGGDYADGLLSRVFANIFHPFLHLGYAFESNQPALVAEALAMLCVHDPESEKLVPIFTEAEKRAGGPGQAGNKTLRKIFEDIRTNPILKASIDGNNPIDRTKNVADNATEEFIKYAAQYSISDEQLQGSIDEMVDTCSLLIATKPQPIKPEDPFKLDFFMLHSVNTLVLVPKLIDHEWISRENAVRLMEWAGRCHMLTYVAQTAPPITPAEIEKYAPRRPWNEIFDRAVNHPSDDGHMQKCIRSLAWGEKFMGNKYPKGDFLIKPNAWLKFGNLVLDKVPYEAKTSEQRWLLWF